MRMAQIEVKSGVETKIKILPKLRSASKEIRQLDPSVRDCKFRDEIEVKFNTKQLLFKYLLRIH